MGELKANIGEHVGAEKREKIKAGLKGKNGKHNPASEAIDDSAERAAVMPMPEGTPAWALVLNQNVANALANDQGQRELLNEHESRLDNLEAKPGFEGVITGLMKAEGEEAKKARAGVAELVRKADTEKLPWGIRHLARARRSNVGQAIETAVLVGIGGYGVYLGGSAGYSKLRGSAD